jgi:hypothetical protein
MPNFFRQGDTLILPAGGIETLTAAISDALESLSMTRCPYYEGTGKCDRGCHSEPSCHTDQPLEGWVGAAIQALEHALPEDEEAAPASRDSQQTGEPS